jgi:DNA-directed RNA polymerase subunit beta'
MPPQNQTFGRFLVNETLPTGYKISGAVSKKSLNTMMNDLARNDPSQYVNTIPRLKQIGDTLATQEGLSVGLDDIEPEYGRRDRVMASFDKKFKQATTDTQRKAIVEQAQIKIQDVSMSHPGEMVKQVRGGARGKPVQFSSIVGSPVYARDNKGSTTPWLIKKSYSEGLSPADYFVAGNESVQNTIKVYTAVAEPGELSKVLISNMSDITITEDDCGTNNGIPIDPKNPDAVDRYLARNEGPYSRNTLVTPIMQPGMAKQSKKVLVRSPMTCEAGDGVCQKCQGLNEHGSLHIVGTNVGVRAAQAMAEPLVQFALDVKHGVRQAKDDRVRIHGIQGFRQIIESPKQFQNKATLATLDGKIDKVDRAPQGGYNITIGKQIHYVSPNLNLKVKTGDTVEAGDVLSQGIPKPDEVVKYKGLGVGRQYMVDSLKDLYTNQGKNLDQRHFELLAKGELNNVRINNDPSNNFLRGDIINYNTFRSTLAKGIKPLSVGDALGETLGKQYLHYSAGMRVTPTVQKHLKKEKIREVMIAPRAPEVEFVMKPATRAPLLNPDWMARLAHRNLKSTIQQAAHFGDVSNIHGTSPVPAYVFGLEFGQGKKGRY